MFSNSTYIFSAQFELLFYKKSKMVCSYLACSYIVTAFFIFLLFCGAASGGDSAYGSTEITSENRLSEEVLQAQSDSLLIPTKTEGDSTNQVIDSTKITELSDSVGSIPGVDTSFVSQSQPVEKKQEKSRRKTEIGEYHGISKDADRCAQQVVLGAYRSDWNEVKRELDHLERIEKRSNLVKISCLLNVSVRIYRLEQDEFITTTERNVVERELDSCINAGLSYAQMCKDSCFPLHELIYCGIKGFQVSRVIERNPVEAALLGYSVIVRLEKLLQSDSTMYDACMGMGLFYCSVATASPVIRAAVALTGRQITLEKGLSYLRTGAQKGHYVNIPSLVYLTQFLSPYLGHHAKEKDSIYVVLQKKCESNPRYLFEQIDEDICFHPEKFTPAYTANLRKKITGYKNADSYVQHYNELMKYQYCRYIDALNCTFKIDTNVNLKRFSFYPAFLDALRYKEACMIHTLGLFGKIHARDCEKNTNELIKKLEAMAMVSTQKEFYRWHILDAIKLR